MTSRKKKVVVKGGRKGQERYKSILVDEFYDLTSGLEFYEFLDANGNPTGEGRRYLLEIFNSEHESHMRRRALAKMSGSPGERLGDLAKTDPILRRKLNELLREVGLPSLEVVDLSQEEE